MEINIREIAEKLLVELNTESVKMKLRAEGVALLYGRIKEAAESSNKSDVSKTEEESTGS